MCVDAEHRARHNRRLTRLLKGAELRIASACVEDVEMSSARGLDEALLRQLGGCSWVAEHHNVLITGLTGVGKSYLASVLGHAACRKGLRALDRRLPQFLEQLALAGADGSHGRVLAKLANPDLLVLDDLGLGSPKESKRHHPSGHAGTEWVIMWAQMRTMCASPSVPRAMSARAPDDHRDARTANPRWEPQESFAR